MMPAVTIITCSARRASDGGAEACARSRALPKAANDIVTAIMANHSGNASPTP
jgi:hypothetical protein